MRNIQILLVTSALGYIDTLVYKKTINMPEAPVWLFLAAVSTVVFAASIVKILKHD
jgi:hypothetical protein